MFDKICARAGPCRREVLEPTIELAVEIALLSRHSVQLRAPFMAEHAGDIMVLVKQPWDSQSP